MRIRDWVVNVPTWNPLGVSGGPQAGRELFYDPLDIETIELQPLTYSKITPSIQEFGVPEVANRMFIQRTQGYFHWNIVPGPGQTFPDMFALNWRAFIKTRITRWPQNPDGTTLGDVDNYNLSDTAPANDQFVFTRSRLLTNHASSDWLGTAGARARIGGSERIDVKYQRTLDDLECMCWITQFTQGELPGDQPWQNVEGRLRLVYRLELRTFVVADT